MKKMKQSLMFILLVIMPALTVGCQAQPDRQPDPTPEIVAANPYAEYLSETTEGSTDDLIYYYSEREDGTYDTVIYNDNYGFYSGTVTACNQEVLLGDFTVEMLKPLAYTFIETRFETIPDSFTTADDRYTEFTWPDAEIDYFWNLNIGDMVYDFYLDMEEADLTTIRIITQREYVMNAISQSPDQIIYFYDDRAEYTEDDNGYTIPLVESCPYMAYLTLSGQMITIYVNTGEQLEELEVIAMK